MMCFFCRGREKKKRLFKNSLSLFFFIYFFVGKKTFFFGTKKTTRAFLYSSSSSLTFIHTLKSFERQKERSSKEWLDSRAQHTHTHATTTTTFGSRAKSRRRRRRRRRFVVEFSLSLLLLLLLLLLLFWEKGLFVGGGGGNQIGLRERESSSIIVDKTNNHGWRPAEGDGLETGLLETTSAVELRRGRRARRDRVYDALGYRRGGETHRRWESDGGQ